MESISSLIDQGLPADIIYLDFQKASDKVPHQQLLVTVKVHGIVERVIGWIRDWLKGRQQRVVLNGSYSKWADMVSEVP